MTGLLEERLDPAIEAAAYFVVSEIVKRNRAGALRIGTRRSNGLLVVDVESAGEAPEDLIDLQDRVGALDGRLEVEDRSNRWTRVRVEIPCA
jgi:signal transduction histidine kinase